MATIDSKLSRNPALYNPRMLTHGTTKMDFEQIKNEYRELRKIAQKRLKRMGQTKYKKSNIYHYNKNRYIPAGEIKTLAQGANLLSDLVRFLRSDTSTIRGMKAHEKKVVKSLRQAAPERRGLKNINEDELEQFGYFMEFARLFYAEAEFDSNRVAELYDSYLESGQKRSFYDLLNTYDEHTKRANNNKGGKDSDWIRKALGLSEQGNLNAGNSKDMNS